MEYLATNFHKRRVQQILACYNNADEILNKSKAEDEEELDVDTDDLDLDDAEDVDFDNDEDQEDDDENIDNVEKALEELGKPLFEE